MKWQDVVISVVSIAFAVALIPTLVGKQKPAFSTGLLTTVGLAVFVVIYLTLGLWLSAMTSAVSAAMWGVITHQSRQVRHDNV